ncbi:MAG TPA: hypothetical protein VHX14_05920 [Thermoanaerobaculia bacterium]|nr:hypothetical protein [Thermoanaerobaculia bacterium]
MRDSATFIAVVVSSLVLGVTGMLCPDRLVRSLGEALFIAAFLAGTVDLFVKRRLAREVSKDVLGATLGYHVPRELQEEIREISSFRIVRQNVDLTYRITPYEGANSYVFVESELEFEVRNLTDSPERFTHLIWVSKPFHNLAPPRQVVYAKAIGVEPGREYELANESLEPRELPNGQAVEWCRTEAIPARAIARYWSKTQQILPVEHTDIFMLVQPSIGIRVRAYADPTLNVTVNFAHRKDDQKEIAGGNTWRLNAGFTPYSAVTIEWRKKSAPTPPSEG